MIQAILVFVFAFLGALLAGVVYGFGYAFGAQFTAPRLAVLLVSGAAFGGLTFAILTMRAAANHRVNDREVRDMAIGFAILLATLGAVLAVAL